MQKYAFTDRDGTFVHEPEPPEGSDPRNTFPLKSVDDFRFMEGGVEGLKALVEKGYKLVLVTNQAYLGTDSYPRSLYEGITERMTSELAKAGVYFDFIMMCPHGPDEGCDCRKPKIGGLKELLEKNEGKIDFAHSLMFGDRDTDRQFAENLGVRFVQIERNTRFEIPGNI